MAKDKRGIKLLTHLFQTIVSVEKSLDRLRKKLSGHKKFDSYSLFKCIDNTSNGYLKLQDLIDFMSSSEFYLTRKQANALYCTLNFDMHGNLNYMEFLNSILPKTFENFTAPNMFSDFYDYTLIKSQKNYGNDQRDIDGILKDLALLLLEYVNQHFIKREVISWFVDNRDHSLGYFFELIDEEKKSYLVDDDIYLFMRDNAKRIENDEVKILIEEFSRFSTQISLNDFINYFTKLETKAKAADANKEIKNLSLLNRTPRLETDQSTRKRTQETMSDVKVSKAILIDSNVNLRTEPSPTKSCQLISDKNKSQGL